VASVAWLRDMLRLTAGLSPDAPALRARGETGWETMSRRRLHDAAVLCASRAEALVAGDERVILVVDNSVPAIVGLLGLWLAGVGVLLVERDSSHLMDAASAVHRVGATAVVGPDAMAAATCPGTRFVGLDRLVSGRPERTAWRGGGRTSEPDVLQLTSGSTGEPRVAHHSLGAVLRGGVVYRERYRLTAADTILLTVPVAHSFGLVGGLAAALAAGAALLTITRFRPGHLREGLEAGATVLLGTPIVYELVGSALTGPRPDGALREALSSGGHLAPRTRARAGDRLGCAVHDVYGSTETGLIASQFARETTWPEGSVGIAAPGVSWRLEPDGVAPADRRNGRGGGHPMAAGRLVVRTSTMFDGYVGGAGAAGGDGYDTGDMARVDGQGHLFIDGRRDTFINVGGRKVNPQRLERLICEHPRVREAAVYGAGAGDLGELVAAAVVADGALTVEELVAWCRARLSRYEVPHVVRVVEALPRTALGKVDRRRLRGAPS
jgi:acyl-CoA synthetase (AMP-forming)/AMP-acid ligase II